MQRSASRFGLNVARNFQRSVWAETTATEQAVERRGVWSAVLLVFVALRGAAAAEIDNVLLDFTATWCGPCQQMSSTVSKLERQGLPVRKVDIDQEPALAKRFNVQSIPCFVLVSNGREIDRATGLTDEKQLRSMLNKLPKPDAIARANVEGPSRGGGLGPAVRIAELDTLGGKRPPIGLPPFIGGQSKAKDSRGVPALPEEPLIARGNNNDSGDASGITDPMLACVRLRVQDGSGINFGSGTIIDSRPGRAVILTCGHIFRKGENDSKIEVDLFRPISKSKVKPETVEGRVLHFDLEADVGLVTIVLAQRVPSVRLGSSRELTVKDRVQSIGCSGGDDPSREEQFLTALNKYDGPDNIECSTMPQQGRSGGGLFLGSELIGVCVAADPKEKRGIYVAMKPVALLLDKVGLGHLAPTPLAVEGALAGTNGTANSTSAPTTLASGSRFGRGLAADRAAVTAADDISRFLASELGAAGLNEGSAAPQDYEGAEIICIVRSKTPGTPSRVVIVNQASGRFVGDLLYESQANLADRTTTRREEPPRAETSRKAEIADHEVRPQQAVAQPRVRRPNPLANLSLSAIPAASIEQTRPFETSFEPQPYRRQRD